MVFGKKINKTIAITSMIIPIAVIASASECDSISIEDAIREGVRTVDSIDQTFGVGDEPIEGFSVPSESKIDDTIRNMYEPDGSFAEQLNQTTTDDTIRNMYAPEGSTLDQISKINDSGNTIVPPHTPITESLDTQTPPLEPYHVQEGDNLTKITQNFIETNHIDTSQMSDIEKSRLQTLLINKIAEVNNIADANLIHTGDDLIMPTTDDLSEVASNVGNKIEPEDVPWVNPTPEPVADIYPEGEIKWDPDYLVDSHQVSGMTKELSTTDFLQQQDVNSVISSLNMGNSDAFNLNQVELNNLLQHTENAYKSGSGISNGVADKLADLYSTELKLIMEQLNSAYPQAHGMLNVGTESFDVDNVKAELIDRIRQFEEYKSKGFLWKSFFSLSERKRLFGLDI